MQTIVISSLLLVVCFYYINCDNAGFVIQKRQSLIPFPRVGRSRIGLNNKFPLIPASRTFQWDDLREGKRHLIPFPRVGKRQSLIPFPRVGRNDPYRDYLAMVDDENDSPIEGLGESFPSERGKHLAVELTRKNEDRGVSDPRYEAQDNPRVESEYHD